MERQPQKQPIPQRSDSERGMAILLLFFLIFELFFLTVTMVRSLRERDSLGEGRPPVVLPPNNQPPTQDPAKPSTSVFSNGVLPTPPMVDGSTVALGSEISSTYAILVDVSTGKVLGQKDADTRFSPASMTKVMTLIVACESLTLEDLDRRLPLTQEAADYVRSGSYEGTSTSLPIESGGLSCIGDEYRIRDLLYGIGVASAADCTYLIACEVAGSEEAFVALMNQKAEQMGLKNTHFDNAVGFDSPNNYTTASEMAMIMTYAMQSDLIVDLLAARESNYDINSYYLDRGQEKTYKVTFKNSLSSRLEKYPAFALTTSRLLATKTGYTTESFMVAAAEGTQSKDRYVLVLGNLNSGATTVTQKFKNTMVDIENLLNTYAK